MHLDQTLEILLLLPRDFTDVDLLRLDVLALEGDSAMGGLIIVFDGEGWTAGHGTEGAFIEDGEGFQEVDGGEQVLPSCEVKFHEAATAFDERVV